MHAAAFETDGAAVRDVTLHLHRGETILWAGKPVLKKYWNELLGSIVFGLILVAFGTTMLAIFVMLGLRGGEPFSWAAAAFPLLFVIIGANFLWAPWRFARAFRETTYAITNQRILILNGLRWGPHVFAEPVGEPLQSLTPDSARTYEVQRRGRDLAFGGEWRPARRGRRWANHGFLCLENTPAAEAALLQLAALHVQEPDDETEHVAHRAVAIP